MSTQKRYLTRSALLLAVLTAAAGIPLAPHDPGRSLVVLYIGVIAVVAIALVGKIVGNAEVEKQQLREAIAAHREAEARAKAARAFYQADHERQRRVLAELDAQAAAKEAEIRAALEQEYANTRATELSEYYRQGVIDGRAGVWDEADPPTVGVIIPLDERRRTHQPPTGSGH